MPKIKESAFGNLWSKVPTDKTSPVSASTPFGQLSNAYFLLDSVLHGKRFTDRLPVEGGLKLSQ